MLMRGFFFLLAATATAPSVCSFSAAGDVLLELCAVFATSICLALCAARRRRRRRMRNAATIMRTMTITPPTTPPTIAPVGVEEPEDESSSGSTINGSGFDELDGASVLVADASSLVVVVVSSGNGNISPYPWDGLHWTCVNVAPG